MLAQMDERRLFVTDGGLETDLIFNRGIDLPEFAAFVLLDDAAAMAAVRDYFDGFFAVAQRDDAGFILDTPTWRASPDWGKRLGYSRSGLRDANTRWVEVMAGIRDGWAAAQPVLLDGSIGPRGDGYVPGDQMTSDEAADYHAAQVGTLAQAGVDMVTVLTMNYAEEASGVAQAAALNGVPAVISFTVETDGRLPTGQPLGEAIEQVDSETGGSPAYYMVNCAHPTHFEDVLDPESRSSARIRGIRANASRRSHAELDEAEDLDAGDPDDLALGYERLAARLPQLKVVGGCCGTDHRHVSAISARFSER
jgi:S-methylmethionine-dependent homocysteine/selenocysteine methylase